MKLKRRSRRRPIMPINAMSDIAFLLLIFIMLISLINYRREIKIDYPEARFKENVQSDRNLEIWIDRSGYIFYKGNRVTLNDAESIITNAIIEEPGVRIHLLADRGAPYKHIDGVTQILQDLQHRTVSFIVREDAAP